MPKKQSDQFANMAAITCVESAATTITFKKLETGISLFEKLAWNIRRIEYFLPSGAYALMNSTADNIAVALTTTNQLTTLDLTNPVTVDLFYIVRADIGTAASGMFMVGPFVHDFSALPGGGVIVPPNPLYGGIIGGGTSGAVTVYMKIWYTNYELEAAEYWELVESRRIIAS